jgi:hypothetical protein
MTSSITCNVGAPTFGVRLTLTKEGEQGSQYSGVSRAFTFAFWNGASLEPSINLKTNYSIKPSSNTLDVGAPTFSLHPEAPASRQAYASPRWRRYQLAVSQ